MSKYNTFISLVTVLNHRAESEQLTAALSNQCQLFETHFSDYEIVLVNNIPGYNIDHLIAPLTEQMKHNIYLLNLSANTNPNHAIVAGLDRANGDYTIIWETLFGNKPKYILDLYKKTQEGFDIVYLQAGSRLTARRFRWMYRMFYFILRHYSQLKLDEKAHNTRIISRRALNPLLRLRENLRYMKAIYSIVGFPTTFLSVEEPLQYAKASFSEQWRTSLVAITSFTNFLRTLMLWIFLGSLAFLAMVVGNAVLVKWSGFDIFGQAQPRVSGWTYLVVFIAVFFAVTNLNLYIMTIYLQNIYSEIKQRPLYIIESIKRF